MSYLYYILTNKKNNGNLKLKLTIKILKQSKF